MPHKKNWQLLLERNQAYASGTLRPALEGVALRNHREQLATEMATPLAMVVTCADPRVCPEAIFQCRLGELFVIRVAGNPTLPSVVASLELGWSLFKIPLVVFLGHTGCGAIGLAVNDWYDQTCPSANQLLDDLRLSLGGEQTVDQAAKVHLIDTPSRIERQSPQLKQAREAHQLDIVQALYQTATGLVHPLEINL